MPDSKRNIASAPIAELVGNLVGRTEQTRIDHCDPDNPGGFLPKHERDAQYRRVNEARRLVQEALTLLIGAEPDLASFLDSEDVNDQRKALLAFCEQIVADAEAREVVIQTDLLGLAQKQTPPRVPAGLLNPSLPE